MPLPSTIGILPSTPPFICASNSPDSLSQIQPAQPRGSSPRRGLPQVETTHSLYLTRLLRPSSLDQQTKTSRSRFRCAYICARHAAALFPRFPLAATVTRPPLGSAEGYFSTLLLVVSAPDRRPLPLLITTLLALAAAPGHNPGSARRRIGALRLPSPGAASTEPCVPDVTICCPPVMPAHCAPRTPPRMLNPGSASGSTWRTALRQRHLNGAMCPLEATTSCLPAVFAALHGAPSSTWARPADRLGALPHRQRRLNRTLCPPTPSPVASRPCSCFARRYAPAPTP